MSQEVELEDQYVQAVKNRWLWLVSGAVISSVLAVTITYFLRPEYVGNAVLLVSLPSGSSGAAAAQLSGGPSPVNLLRGVALSSEAVRRTSKDTGIPMSKLAERLDAKAELQRNQLILAVVDTDKSAAASIVTKWLKNTDTLAKETGFGVASKQAVAIKSALDENISKLKDAEKALSEFQKNASTVTNPSDPTSALFYANQARKIQAQMDVTESALRSKMSEVRASGRNANLPSDLTESLPARRELLDAELEYERARSQYGDDSPKLKSAAEKLESSRTAFRQEVSNQLRNAAEGLDEEVANYQAQLMVLSVQEKMWRNLAKQAPGEAMELTKLAFEVETYEAIVDNLRQKYEKSLLDMDVDAITYSVLSPPKALPDPVNKDYVLNGFFGALVGVFLAGGVAIMRTGR